MVVRDGLGRRNKAMRYRFGGLAAFTLMYSIRYTKFLSLVVDIADTITWRSGSIPATAGAI